MLQSRLVREGNWLFRWRSYLPLALVLPMLAAFQEFRYVGGQHFYQELWCVACLLVSFFGLGVRVLTVGFAPAGTSGRNTRSRVAETLNTTGMYSLCRNPLYLGNYLILLGPVLFFFNAYLVSIVTLLFWLYYERIIFAEEAFLLDKFGADYEAWAEQTPAFIPRLSGWRRPALSFSLRTVLRREYSGFFLIIVTFCALETAEHWVVEGMLLLEIQWQLTLLVGLAIYLLLRSLKKHTQLLFVEGR